MSGGGGKEWTERRKDRPIAHNVALNSVVLSSIIYPCTMTFTLYVGLHGRMSREQTDVVIRSAGIRDHE